MAVLDRLLLRQIVRPLGLGHLLIGHHDGPRLLRQPLQLLIEDVRSNILRSKAVLQQPL